MWHSITNIAKNRFLSPEIAREVAFKNPSKYGMNNEMIGTADIDLFVNDVKLAQGKNTDSIRSLAIKNMQKELSESFEVGDLKLVLQPKISIDEFSSKIGKDDEICVLSFVVNDHHAAVDLVDFLEKGYDFILDADISASEITPGSYLVFVELIRRMRIIPQIFKIISDLEAASGLNKKDWTFRYVTSNTYHKLTKENLKKYVPLSARVYKEIVKKPIEEMKKLSGIQVNESFSNDDITLKVLQHAAGIDKGV